MLDMVRGGIALAIRNLLVLLCFILMLFAMSCVHEADESNRADGPNKNDYSETRVFGYIDETGNMVIEPQYPEAHEFSEGLALAAFGGGLGFIDHNGETEIEPKFSSARSFSEGLAAVKPKDEVYWRYINKTGNYAIETDFLVIQSFSEGKARVWSANTSEEPQGFIDKTGEYVIPPELEGIEYFGGIGDFNDGRALIAKKTYVEGALKIDYGFINSEGFVVIEPQFYEAGRFSEGLAAVDIAGKWGYIDVNGNVIMEPYFDDAGIFNEGIAPVEIDGKWGYIDIHGDIAIEPQYEDAGIFSEGLAAVKIGEKWGYIDRNGNIIIDPQYAEEGYFSEGVAPVRY
jgi:hypothetical protein